MEATEYDRAMFLLGTLVRKHSDGQDRAKMLHALAHLANRKACYDDMNEIVQRCHVMLDDLQGVTT